MEGEKFMLQSNSSNLFSTKDVRNLFLYSIGGCLCLDCSCKYLCLCIIISNGLNTSINHDHNRNVFFGIEKVLLKCYLSLVFYVLSIVQIHIYFSFHESKISVSKILRVNVIFIEFFCEIDRIAITRRNHHEDAVELDTQAL